MSTHHLNARTEVQIADDQVLVVIGIIIEWSRDSCTPQVLASFLHLIELEC